MSDIICRDERTKVVRQGVDGLRDEDRACPASVWIDQHMSMKVSLTRRAPDTGDCKMNVEPSLRLRLFRHFDSQHHEHNHSC